MLIRDAEIWRGQRASVRIDDGKIIEIGQLYAQPGEQVIEAGGGLLLPGLHDHHIHLAATAASMASVDCGPPQVVHEGDLAAALAGEGDGWLRGIGYHESVAGSLDRSRIDAWQSERPVRIQHRSGRMWYFNSSAVDLLAEADDIPDSFDIATGRLFDADSWLRRTLGAIPPALGTLGKQLAQCGVTGVTEISPANGIAEARWLSAQQANGNLPQRCVIAGKSELAICKFGPGLALGPRKLHLHEHALPEFPSVVDDIRKAHAQCRPVAVHCTTELELVFTLAALAEAGTLSGDRIEHAGIATDDLVEQVAEMGLRVVSQPHFIEERGDRYLLDVPEEDHQHLYRLRSFAEAGVTLAAGSDAPYGTTDPWAAMRAACSRETLNGRSIGPSEALTPEAALALYLCDPLDLKRQRSIAEGEPANLCLLDQPWSIAREKLHAGHVRATWIAGKLVHDRVDQPPVERLLCPDPAA